MVQYTDCSSAEEVTRQPVLSWSPRIVYIRTTITGLTSGFIPFAVLRHNPLPRFRRSIQEIEPASFGDQAGTILAVQEIWNRPFVSLEPHQLFFIDAWSSARGASAKVRNTAGLTFGIATPGDDYKRWLATYAVQRQSELVAWCEEVDLRGIQEKLIEIVLSEANMLHLSAAWVPGFKVA